VIAAFGMDENEPLTLVVLPSVLAEAELGIGLKLLLPPPSRRSSYSSN
jgi:hypothetical protein